MHRMVRPGLLLAAVLCLSACERPTPGRGAGDAPVGETQKTHTLTLLTYNVLADRAAEGERVPALLKALEESDADIIALQEVAPWFLRTLLAEPWVKDDYHTTMAQDEPLVARGLFILSKHPIERAYAQQLPGRQGRAVLVAAIDVHGRRTLVATVHLESPLDAGQTRASQLDIAFGLLADSGEAILLGDFNFGDGEKPEAGHLDKSFPDMWLALRPTDPGFTWNIEKSQMAAQGSFPGETSRRIDRILVKSKLWRPRSIRIIGNEPVVSGRRDVFPSDHFGVVGVLESRLTQGHEDGLLPGN